MKSIHEDLILLDIDVSSKEQLLGMLSNAVHQNGFLNCRWKASSDDRCHSCLHCARDGYYNSLIEREQTYPTAVGLEFAIPHGRCLDVSNSVIAFARLNQAIDWDGTGEMVRYVFMIGVNTSAGNEHLRMLANLSMSILEDEFRDQLATLSSKTSILKLIEDYSQLN